ncbi:unnamed protein product [Heterobilharzia americana]|nr:unnamed protein product [Heterobilharzia americana]
MKLYDPDNMILHRLISLSYYFTLLSTVVLKNSVVYTTHLFQSVEKSSLLFKISELFKKLCLKFGYTLIIILVMIVSYSKFDIFKLFNPVDASVASSIYFIRPTRFYLPLSRDKQHSPQSYIRSSEREITPKTSNSFTSESAFNNHANDYHFDSTYTSQFNEIKHQTDLIIEKYKKKILSQLNMRSVPKVNFNNKSEWDSLPILLRKRLKAEIDASNKMADNLVDEDEEKETLILLNQYQLPVKLPNTNIFTLKIAEDIDPMHISRVTLHVEINGEIHPNSKFTCWEITPKLFEYKFPWINNDGDDNLTTLSSIEQVNDDDYDENENEIYPKVSSLTDVEFTMKSDLYSNQETSYSLFPNDYRKLFKLSRPEIAHTTVPEGHLSPDLTMNITNRMVHWLKYGEKAKPHRPMIKYLLITCNDCNNEQNIIDPKKVVVEIRYRLGLQRRKRSSTKGDKALYNVCRPTGHHFGCCTQPLSVKFTDIGWDNWIIHPKSFEPNYCRGSCKITSTKSLHYDVMDLLLRRNFSQFGSIQRDEVQSCCHPTHLTSMSVLYLDSNRELQMHTLHNLIVLGCGCS